MTDFQTKFRDQVVKASGEGKIGRLAARIMLRIADDQNDCEMIEHHIRSRLFPGRTEAIDWENIDWEKWIEVFKIIMQLISMFG
jgi:hypothetical protein